MIIRKANINDVLDIFFLYKSVAQAFPGNLTQEVEEITFEYVKDCLLQAMQRGLALVIEKDGKIIGYMKAFTSRFKCLAHVLTDGTMMIHPKYAKTSGYGAKLFIKFMYIVKEEMKHILRCEILPHDSNIFAINMFQKLGYKLEATASKKIRNTDGTFGGEVCVTWENPNFDSGALEKYHQYLLALIKQQDVFGFIYKKINDNQIAI